jgi:uncharacterized HAD superfamily protein
MTINTLYYNSAIVPGRPAGNEAASFHYVTNDENHIRQKIQKAVYLNFNDAGLSPAMKKVLAEIFPGPSQFEADTEIKPIQTSAFVPTAVPIITAPPQSIPWTQMLMYDDLARDSRELIGRLPPEIDAVAGSARSGLIPATIIATALHLQLFSIGAQGVVFPGQGNRLSKKWPLPRCVLVVEDTASSGNAITEAAAKAAKNWPNAKIIKAAIYASSRGAKACDLVGKIYERPHFLEWNFPNAWIYANMAYDFDGIFCEDCPKGADDDGPRYEEFLRNARPKYLPRKYPVKLIVTARLEKWRPQTEAWLRRHRIAFQGLAMGPWPSLPVRRAAHDVDKFKAYCLAHSSCYAFAESEPAQAESICRLARKPVLCPEARRFFVPHGYSWPRMSKLLKA